MYRFDFRAMASPCSIQIDPIDGQDEASVRHAAQQAIAEVQRIEQKYSRYLSDSILCTINKASGHNPVSVDEETAGLLDFAHNLWALSDGLFDITSGVLRKAWNFHTQQLPEEWALQALRPLVGWEKIEHTAETIYLPQAGMELDFGGFGKEYAADRAMMVLHNLGFRQALVNLGGDLHALGERDWAIDIQHPRQNNAPLAVLSLQHGGLATSGDYERFFMHQGKRYCHVLNPRTGWPVSYWQSVTVLAGNTTTAGALTTIAMLKEENATAWLQTQGVRFLAVRHDGEMVVGRGGLEPTTKGL